MTEIYQSTMALSVYNALSLTGRDMSREQVDAFLRENFDPKLPEDYVAQGAAYLLEKGFAAETDGALKIDRLPNGRGRPLARTRDDRNLSRADGDLLRGAH